jgi:hypothetical protein
MNRAGASDIERKLGPAAPKVLYAPSVCEPFGCAQGKLRLLPA